MQKQIVVMVLTLLFTGTGAAQNQRSADLERKIMDLEHRWIKAATEKNAETVSQFLTEKYVYVWPDGSVHERNEYLADVGKTTWHVNEISDTRVILYGETAIVLGTWRGKGSDSSGQPIDGTQRYSDIWVKSPDGKWRCALSQSSEIPK